MAILGQLTLNEILILEVDADPSTSGVTAPIGSIATLDDKTNGRIWIKSGAADTAWAIITRHVDGTQLTQGGVLYASTQGFVQQNAANLFWDTTNLRLGIGTNAPSAPLHVQGTASSSGLIRATATNGVSFLDMKNDANSYIETGMYGTASTTTLFGVNMANSGFIVGAGANMVIGNFTAAPVVFGTNSVERMRIDSTGPVLIGGTAPVDITGASVFPPFQILGTSATQMVVSQYSADANPSVVNLLKSRGATIGAQGLVVSGDDVGRLQFRASDGVNFQPAASIRATIDGTAAAGSMPGRLVFFTTPSGSTAPLERMRIDNAGNVTIGGILGSTLSNNPLSVNGSVNAFLQSNVQNTLAGTSASSDVIATGNNGTDTTNYVDMGINSSAFADAAWTINGANDAYIYSGSTNLSVGTAGAGYINFFTGDTLAANERMRISATGNVGIGINNPQFLLQVNGNTLIGSTVPANIPSVPLNLVNSAGGALRTQLNLVNTGGGAGAGSAIDFYTFDAGPNPGGRIGVVDDNFSARIAFSTKIPGAAGNALAERMTITNDGRVGINASPVASAILQVDSTTQGFLMPRMTNAQMLAIATPAAGLQIFNTDLGVKAFYTGSFWQFDYSLATTAIQTVTVVTPTTVTELTTASLPVGRYQFIFTGVFQSTALTTGFSVRLGLGTAAVGALLIEWMLPQAANGTAQTFQYSQLAATTDVPSASVITANADIPVFGMGIVQISTAGTLALQIRSEVAASGISIRPNSVMLLRKIT